MKWTISLGFVLILIAVAIYVVAAIMDWSDLLAFFLAGLGASQLNRPLFLRRDKK